jgi:hypothetical protein
MGEVVGEDEAIIQEERDTISGVAWGLIQVFIMGMA